MKYTTSKNVCQILDGSVDTDRHTDAFNISQGLVPRAADSHSSRKSKTVSSSPKGKSSPSSRGGIGKLAALKNMPPEIFFLVRGHCRLLVPGRRG